MNPSPSEKLNKLGIVLPSSIPPAGNYVRAVATGNLLFLSGHLPDSAGEPLVTGKLGETVSVSQGYDAARQAIVAMLGTIQNEIGSIDRVTRFIKLLGLVNSTTDFTEQPQVINGASDLLHEVFGEKAIHARSAVGMAQLPRNNSVEIEGVVEFDPR